MTLRPIVMSSHEFVKRIKKCHLMVTLVTQQNLSSDEGHTI